MKWKRFCCLVLVGISLQLSCRHDGTRQPEDGSITATSTSLADQQLQPAAEMGKLMKAFEGTWSITEDYVPGPSMPKGGIGHGEEVWRPGPGGHSIIEEYRSHTPSGQVSGLGLIWWDAQAQRYQALWCESDLPAGCVSPSDGMRWQGDQLVYLDERGIGTSKTVFKETFSEISSSSFTQTLEVGSSLAELRPTLRIRAKR